MKIENNKIYIEDKKIDLYSKEGFRYLSDLWIKVGWDQKYQYGFSWLGRPIIQLPDDMIRFQELVWKIKPTKIIETGIAHGGSLVYSASLLNLIGNPKSEVIGIDIDIRDHNLTEILNHPVSSKIKMIEGSSVDPNILSRVKEFINWDDIVLVILDSCHDYTHVLEELKLYSDLVTLNSFIICTDGVQKFLSDSPRAVDEYPQSKTWVNNNPLNAALDFIKENDDFIIDEPVFPFNEGYIDFTVTHWPSSYLKRIK